MTSEAHVREKLAGEIDLADWAALAPHATAGRLFVVASELALLDAAVAVASDDKEQVEPWIASGQLARPTASQVEHFQRQKGLGFACVIVSPFVLAQGRRVEEASDDGAARKVR
jgi:hypothetical protein